MDSACKLYLTYRSEYLVLRDLCVGVRDRRTGVWIPMHAASCAHVLGPIDAHETSHLPAMPVRIGERLSLHASARRIVTGPIVAIEQATASTVLEADRQWQALFRPESPRHSLISLATDVGAPPRVSDPHKSRDPRL